MDKAEQKNQVEKILKILAEQAQKDVQDMELIVRSASELSLKLQGFYPEKVESAARDGLLKSFFKDFNYTEFNLTIDEWKSLYLLGETMRSAQVFFTDAFGEFEGEQQKPISKVTENYFLGATLLVELSAKALESEKISEEMVGKLFTENEKNILKMIQGLYKQLVTDYRDITHEEFLKHQYDEREFALIREKLLPLLNKFKEEVKRKLPQEWSEKDILQGNIKEEELVKKHGETLEEYRTLQFIINIVNDINLPVQSRLNMLQARILAEQHKPNATAIVVDRNIYSEPPRARWQEMMKQIGEMLSRIFFIKHMKHVTGVIGFRSAEKTPEDVLKDSIEKNGKNVGRQKFVEPSAIIPADKLPYGLAPAIKAIFANGRHEEAEHPHAASHEIVH